MYSVNYRERSHLKSSISAQHSMKQWYFGMFGRLQQARPCGSPRCRLKIWIFLRNEKRTLEKSISIQSNYVGMNATLVFC